jgi:hypothetical protein
MIVKWKNKKALLFECENLTYLENTKGGYNIMVSNIKNLNNDKIVKSYLESWQNISIGYGIIKVDTLVNTEKEIYETNYYYIENEKLKFYEFDLRGCLSKCIFQTESIIPDVTRKYKIENFLEN